MVLPEHAICHAHSLALLAIDGDDHGEPDRLVEHFHRCPVDPLDGLIPFPALDLGESGAVGYDDPCLAALNPSFPVPQYIFSPERIRSEVGMFAFAIDVLVGQVEVPAVIHPLTLLDMDIGDREGCATIAQ